MQHAAIAYKAEASAPRGLNNLEEVGGSNPPIPTNPFRSNGRTGGTVFKRLLAVFALLVTSLGVAVQPAAADTSSELASCTWGDNGVGYAYGGGEYTGSGDWYAYSWQFVTLSNSACEDIQITNRYTQSTNMRYRVRFYPSSGGNYANAWKPINGGGCWTCNFVLATDVANGT